MTDEGELQSPSHGNGDSLNVSSFLFLGGVYYNYIQWCSKSRWLNHHTNGMTRWVIRKKSFIIRSWMVSLQYPTMIHFDKQYTLKLFGLLRWIWTKISGSASNSYQLRRIKNIGLGKQTLLQDIINKRG